MWRELYGRSIANVDIETIGDEPFHASVTFQGLPGVGLVTGSRSPAHYHVTRQHLARARDGFGLSMLMSGAATTRQLGREIICRPGAASVISGTDPSVNTMHSLGSFITIVLPRPEVSALVPDLGAAYARQIPADNGALRLLIRYVQTLHENGPLDAGPAKAAASHIFDLAALAIGANADAAHEARHRGVAAARLQSIKAEIRECLGDGDLSAATLALAARRDAALRPEAVRTRRHDLSSSSPAGSSAPCTCCETRILRHRRSARSPSNVASANCHISIARSSARMTRHRRTSVTRRPYAGAR
ncbi:hypothetical protein [Bradyrhizobium sp. CB82]|uniref:cupin domain-containing protein n=1 Tax=Bradyrhizobium sp. CB82 TaxID=3039159 RepID=UPI0032C2343D